MSESAQPLVVCVVTPEKGIYLVRTEALPAPRTHLVVALDYGEDEAVALEGGVFDPTRHGDSLPSFQVRRLFDDEDQSRTESNRERAQGLCTTFLRFARERAGDLRVVSSRLSLGGERLFVRYLASSVRPDLSRAFHEVKSLFGVAVSAWQLGPRDEVAALGALGPCGQVCCCAAWQTRFPLGLTAERARACGCSGARANGVCGKFKCCLAFED